MPHRKSHAPMSIPLTYQFLNRQVSRPCTFDLMLDSASLGVVWMIFANFDIRSTGSFCAIPGFMSVPPQNGHIFSKHCIYGNFHPRGLKFWPVRDFLQGQTFYFLIHGQKMPFSCGFFIFVRFYPLKRLLPKIPYLAYFLSYRLQILANERFIYGSKKIFYDFGPKNAIFMWIFSFSWNFMVFEAFTKNPTSRIFFELQTSNFGKWEIFTWVKIVVLWLMSKRS